MTTVPLDDLQYADDLVTVYWTPPAPTSPEDSRVVEGCFVGPMGIREASASGGQFETNDVVVRLRKSSLSSPPEVGGTVCVPSYHDAPMVVLAVLDSPKTGTYRLVCQRMAPPSSLTVYVTVDRAVVRRDTDGAPYVDYVPVAERIRSGIVLVTRTIERLRSAKRVDSEYRIVVLFESEVTQLSPSDRVVTEDGEVYIVSSVTYNSHVPGYQILKAYQGSMVEGDR